MLQAPLVRDRSKNPEAEQGGQGRAWPVRLPPEHWDVLWVQALGGQPRGPVVPWRSGLGGARAEVEERDGDIVPDVLVLELSLVRGESCSVPGPAVTSLPLSDRGQGSNSQTLLPFRGFQGGRRHNGCSLGFHR